MASAEEQEYSYELKIPKERIAVLIGTKGETKKQLEQATNTRLEIDSENGDVIMYGKDAILLYTTKEIITAISRGFNPQTAMLLLKQDYAIEIINLKDAARTQNDLIRLRARIIGEGGRARATIESLTQTYISVFGKTISIIGSFEGLSLARRAIEMLIKGSTHGNVYKLLEKRQKELRPANSPIL